jgi:hypothetical protein
MVISPFGGINGKAEGEGTVNNEDRSVEKKHVKFN